MAKSDREYFEEAVAVMRAVLTDPQCGEPIRRRISGALIIVEAYESGQRLDYAKLADSYDVKDGSIPNVIALRDRLFAAMDRHCAGWRDNQV